jgi:hypothetical protein
MDSYEYIYDFRERYDVPLFAVPFTFGTNGNVILLIIIICNKDMRTAPSMYILNLAISNLIYITVDFSQCCASMISNTWLDSYFLRTFFPFCDRVSIGMSAYSVAVLSIQRYRATVNPIHVRVSSQPTWRTTVATICGVWIVAALFALPPAFSQDLCQECYGPRCIIYHKKSFCLNS